MRNKNKIRNKAGRFCSFDTPEEQFYSKIERGVVKDKCWIWQGCKSSDGYGKLTYKGKDERAHRFSWKLFRGEIPPAMFVCHKCDNPSCVNPDHLWLGTPKDNADDMRKKMRNYR